MIFWYRGELGEDRVRLSLDGAAFRFGAGVFETICYNGRTLCHLARHLERMDRSLGRLGLPSPELDEAALAGAAMEVVRANGLERSWARVNLYCLCEEGGAHPLVTARPHEPAPRRTYRLAVHPERHLTPLAGHKTMNYLFYHLAGESARAAGHDGALLTDGDGLVVETDSSALLFSSSGRFTAPESRFALPSTALEVASKVLAVERRPVALDELESFDRAYILNSMIGMRPVASIGGTVFEEDEVGCGASTAAVLQLGG